MADEEQLALLLQGVDAWSAWCKARLVWSIDLQDARLRGANLKGAQLNYADLSRADLEEADLTGAFLRRATLHAANLRRANLGGAYLYQARGHGIDLREASLKDAVLYQADLTGAKCTGANFIRADCYGTNFQDADLRSARLNRTDLTTAKLEGAKFRETILGHTILADVNLAGVNELTLCIHRAPSVVDHLTLQRSGPLPLSFLQGVGLPDNLIDYLPSLFNQAIQFYSCFISYSSKDEDFAHRLHADLQAKGVRCWFAPEDMKIGDRIRDTIDRAIRVRDKLLVVLSENSIGSPWVEEEVETALEEERHSPDRRTVLFPVRIDGAVLHTELAWARKLRRERHIGDFTRWKEHDAYQTGFERLLRDLKPELERRPDQGA